MTIGQGLFRPGATLLVLGAVCWSVSPTAQARVTMGYAAEQACEAAGCNYFGAKGACVMPGDGADGLSLILNRTVVKLRRKERLAVFRKRPNVAMGTGNRFMSVYESVESSIGGVRVQILDTIVQPKGTCEPGTPECKVVHSKARIRITTPRDVIDFHGRGVCPARG